MLAYCDKIAFDMRSALVNESDTPNGVVLECGPVKMDLHPTEGWFQSTKKTFEVFDRNGKKYNVTVEEV